MDDEKDAASDAAAAVDVVPGAEELSMRPDDEISTLLESAARDRGAVAVPALERLAMGSEPRVARVAARVLGLVRDPGAADALARVREDARDREVRKEAGRSLHRLRSAGVQPAARPEKRAAPPGAARLAGSIERALVTWYGHAGERVLTMLARAPAGRLLYMGWLVDEAKGIVDATVRPMSRHEFGEWEEAFRRGEHGDELVSIEPAHARFLLAEAAEVTHRAGRKLPDEYAAYRDVVEALGQPPDRPIIYERMDAAEVEKDASALAESHLLHDLRWCRWTMEPEKMKAFREKAEAVLKSVIVTSGFVRQERLDAIIDEAIAAGFTLEVARMYQRRLEETAYLLLLTGQERQARAAFAAALAIARGKPPRAIPFVVELAARSVGLFPEDSSQAREAARIDAGLGQPGPRLIIDPSDPRFARSQDLVRGRGRTQA